MRVPTLILAAALGLAPVALASGGGEDKPIMAQGDNTVELPLLVAPVTVDGKLYHYAYMRVVLETSSGGVVAKAYDKVPFILDAMLRETHRASIVRGSDPKEIDGEALKKRLLDVANGVMGAGSFVNLTFRDTIQTDGEPVDPPEMADTSDLAKPDAAATGH